MQNQTDKPNVLLICVDNWPGHLLGGAGSNEIFSPTIDQMMDNGISFSECYSTSPMCIPARRALMTGTTAKTHGDRVFQERLTMPENLPTMAQTFGNAGYQTYAVGKMHVYPQRDRIGFDEILICEEGRHHLGMDRDDYEIYLSDKGKTGQEQTHGMGVSQYNVRPWHLDEELTPTYWAAKQTCRAIQRRNPSKPGFWYCSFNAPHQPLTPPKCYLDMYKDVDVPEPVIGDWAKDFDNLPYALKLQQDQYTHPTGPNAKVLVKKAHHALCTYVDHQIRLIIGTLNEQGLTDNTIVMFTSDHGEMLGDHNQYAKRKMYETATKIPMVMTLPPRMKRTGVQSDNLVCLRDVMPTLLNLCDIDTPETVEGLDMLGSESRDYLYGEHDEGLTSTRMIRRGAYKLIYYACGNRFYLFNVDDDPKECHDLLGIEKYNSIVDELKELLLANLYGSDEAFIRDGEIVGLPDKQYEFTPSYNLAGQRGWRL
ncbi:MAG: sulfatase-like hydrolase/transferase [Clostridia bacterium]|jgi:arylsulfatase|nr:sulfatase-like hydrolase/transferase [Clostridia bacterium]MBT7123475.1 sulfatase-like hydrolase/transferase [Clostridia bacterium]